MRIPLLVSCLRRRETLLRFRRSWRIFSIKCLFNLFLNRESLWSRIRNCRRIHLLSKFIKINRRLLIWLTAIRVWGRLSWLNEPVVFSLMLFKTHGLELYDVLLFLVAIKVKVDLILVWGIWHFVWHYSSILRGFGHCFYQNWIRIIDKFWS